MPVFTGKEKSYTVILETEAASLHCYELYAFSLSTVEKA